MKQSNLKKKNLAKKPFQKKKVSFGVLAVEKNPKSETLVIAKEQSDRSNLTPWRHPEQSEGSLYRSPRFARNDKGASGNDKGVALSLRGVQNQLDDEAISGIATLPLVARNDKSVGAWNFKSWHKIFAAKKTRSVECLNDLRYN